MKKYGRFFSSAVIANGECPSDFAALVTSPQSEEAFSRALPAQKAPRHAGSWPSLRGLRGFAGLCVNACYRAAASTSAAARGRPPYMCPGNISLRSAAKHPRAVKSAQGCFYLLSFPRRTPLRAHSRTRRGGRGAGSACTRAWPRPRSCCRRRPRRRCAHP